VKSTKSTKKPETYGHGTTKHVSISSHHTTAKPKKTTKSSSKHRHTDTYGKVDNSKHSHKHKSNKAARNEHHHEGNDIKQFATKYWGGPEVKKILPRDPGRKAKGRKPVFKHFYGHLGPRDVEGGAEDADEDIYDFDGDWEDDVNDAEDEGQVAARSVDDEDGDELDAYNIVDDLEDEDEEDDENEEAEDEDEDETMRMMMRAMTMTTNS